MGNQAGSLKKHLETAEKTGALNFTDQGLEKFPSDMSKVSFLINLMRQLQCTMGHVVIFHYSWRVSSFKLDFLSHFWVKSISFCSH